MSYGQKAKHYLQWVKFIVISFQMNGSVKIRLPEKGPSIPIIHTADFEKYFPGLECSKVDKIFIFIAFSQLCF